MPQLVGLLGSPAAGYLSDRIGRRGVILIAIGMMGPSFLLLTLVPNEIVILPLIVLGDLGGDAPDPDRGAGDGHGARSTAARQRSAHTTC